MSTKQGSLLDDVIKFYLNSRDFNGLPLGPHAKASEVVEAIELTKQGLIQLMTSDDYLNPHIRPWQSRRSTDEQVESLTTLKDAGEYGLVCLYPTHKAMKGVRIPKRYNDRPFEKELAKGTGVLELAYFTPDVLEFYRNDPRYECRIGDFSVYMSVSDDVYGDEGEPDKDKVSLEHAGFAYDLSDFDKNDINSQIDDIKDRLNQILELKAKIAKIDNKLELTGDFELTVDEFLNIANVAADKMRAGDPVEKDAIARLLLLNVEMGYKKAPSYRWKEPFATLMNQHFVNSGADKRT